MPFRLALDDALVQAVQRVELDRIQLCRHDDDEVDIADAASEVAGDQRAVEIDADELIAQD